MTKLDAFEETAIVQPDDDELGEILMLIGAIHPIIAGQNMGDIATAFARMLTYGTAPESDASFEVFLAKFVELMRLDRMDVKQARMKSAN